MAATVLSGQIVTTKDQGPTEWVSIWSRPERSPCRACCETAAKRDWVSAIFRLGAWTWFSLFRVGEAASP